MFSWLLLAAQILAEILVSAQTARTEGPRFVQAEGNGCKVWSSPLEGSEIITWSGPCPAGLAEGMGVAEWVREGRVVGRLEGRLCAGKADGFAIATWSNGDRYEGEWRDGLWYGRGL